MLWCSEKEGVFLSTFEDPDPHYTLTHLPIRLLGLSVICSVLKKNQTKEPEVLDMKQGGRSPRSSASNRKLCHVCPAKLLGLEERQGSAAVISPGINSAERGWMHSRDRQMERVSQKISAAPRSYFHFWLIERVEGKVSGSEKSKV